ncbi:DNA polymerase [Mycobacteroides chelonae]|uniref:DNA polymerase n=1 Tax=Mycobacteroides chelonae TaxID=1774 RepID=UPI001E2C7A9C|nr:DNA polymerase [Mycobacteroides chelonae]
MAEGTLTFDVETHSAELLYSMEPEEFIRLIGYAWGDGEVVLTTSVEEIREQILKARWIIGHNIHAFDLRAVFGIKSDVPLELAQERRVYDTWTHAALVHPAPYMFVNRFGKNALANSPDKMKRWFSLDEQAHQLGVPGKTHDLKALAKEFGGFGSIPVDDERYREYLVGDVVASRAVARELLKKGKLDAYALREQEIAARAAVISSNGFRVDVDGAKSRVADLRVRREAILEVLQTKYGLPTEGKSPWATKEGKEAIMSALADHGITPKTHKKWTRTATGNPSLGGEVLTELTQGTSAEDLGKALAELKGQRSLAQLALDSTHPDGFVHPDITMLQRSGRWSTTEPGLTVWTSRGEGAVEKSYFLPDNDDEVLLELDYSNCFLPYSKVLTTDLRWVQVSELTPGDSVVGFDEDLTYKKSKMRSSTVVGVQNVRVPAVRISLSNGDVLVCGSNHLWPVKKDKAPRSWKTAEKIVPGDSLTRWAGKPWSAYTDYESGWVAGMYDGEGWVSGSSTGVSQKPGECLDRLRVWHERHGFPFTEDTQSNGVNVLRVLNVSDRLRLLGSLRPSRLLPKADVLWDDKSAFGNGCYAPEKVTVVSVDHVGMRELVSVQTTTHTLVVDGYLTHNCDARIVAAYSGDRRYAERFEPGADGHMINAVAAWGQATVDTDPKKYRQMAKPLGHGWSYGGRPGGLVKVTGLPFGTAKQFCDGMDATYTQLVNWQDNVRGEAQRGYVTNEWGRKLWVEKDRIYTQAPALKGQNGTREIVCDALLRMPTHILRRVKAQIHDAVLFSVPKHNWEACRDYLIRLMDTEFEPRKGGQLVDFPVSAGPPGANWMEASHE